MVGGALSQLTASKAGSSGTVRNWHPLTGGADVNAGEYYGKNSGRYFPGGSSELKVPCHAYGQGRASSFGAVHDDWKVTGPNLAPYPGSSGMMTGGAKRKVKKQTKRANGKKVVKDRKTKKVVRTKRGGGGNPPTLTINFNGNNIIITTEKKNESNNSHAFKVKFNNKERILTNKEFGALYGNLHDKFVEETNNYKQNKNKPNDSKKKYIDELQQIVQALFYLNKNETTSLTIAEETYNTLIKNLTQKILNDTSMLKESTA